MAQMGRPKKDEDRKRFLQAAFKLDEVKVIAALARKENKTVSVVVRELAIAGLARRK